MYELGGMVAELDEVAYRVVTDLIARAEAAEAKNEGLSSLLDALGEMSDKYDVMFYPSVRYWEAARWIKAAQKGATFSVADKDGAKLLVWDKED